MANGAPHTFVIQRSVVVLAEGFSPLLLRRDIINPEIVGPEPPQAITTPVLSQLQYPGGLQITLTDDKFQVLCERPRLVPFEQLVGATHDFLRRNELVAYRALGLNVIGGVDKREGDLVGRLDATFFPDRALNVLSDGPKIRAAFEATFPAEQGRCTVRIERNYNEEAETPILLNLNFHQDLAGWKDLQKLLKDHGRGERVYSQTVMRLAMGATRG